MSNRARTVRKLARATKYAAMRAQGVGMTDAWRAVTPNWRELKEQSQYSMASEFASDPVVRLKVDEILKHASAQAMASKAAYVAELQQDIELARNLDNLNAVMAGQRIKGLALEHLTEKHTIDNKNDDRQLVERLKQLGYDASRLLVADSFDTEPSRDVTPVLPADSAGSKKPNTIN